MEHFVGIRAHTMIIRKAVRSIAFGFSDNLILVGPPGCGMGHMTIEELTRHNTPYERITCSHLQEDEASVASFVKFLDHYPEVVMVLEESGRLPVRYGNIIAQRIKQQHRKGVIALCHGLQDYQGHFMPLAGFITNVVDLEKLPNFG